MDIPFVKICSRLLRDSFNAFICHQCKTYAVQRGTHPLYYIFNSRENMFSFPNSYMKLHHVSDFKLKTVYGGTQRRPELKERGCHSYHGYSKEQTLVYAKSERVKRIQTELTQKALELLDYTTEVPRNGIAVDIGCGSGISANVLRDTGYYVIGVDSNAHMLDIFNTSTSQDCVQLDIFSRLPFRQNSVGVVLGISSLQWIFVQKDYHKMLHVMFASICNILERGGSAVIQYYPRNISEVMATVEVAEEHFTNGALVVDFPHSHRGKKLFLLLLKT